MAGAQAEVPCKGQVSGLLVVRFNYQYRRGRSTVASKNSPIFLLELQYPLPQIHLKLTLVVTCFSCLAMWYILSLTIICWKRLHSSSWPCADHDKEQDAKDMWSEAPRTEEAEMLRVKKGCMDHCSPAGTSSVPALPSLRYL